MKQLKDVPLPQRLLRKQRFTRPFGLQRKALRAWSLKAEYQYFDFGGEKATGLAANSENGIKVFDFKDLTANTVKAGIDYHLSPPYEPLK